MRSLPNNLPAGDLSVTFLDITENQALAFELAGTNLARSNITVRSRDFWQVHNLFSFYIDLIAAAICEDSVSGGNIFVQRGTNPIIRFGSIGVFYDDAHISISLVHQEALAVRTELRKGARASAFKRFLGRDEFPSAYNSTANLRFRFAEYGQFACDLSLSDSRSNLHPAVGDLHPDRRRAAAHTTGAAREAAVPVIVAVGKEFFPVAIASGLEPRDRAQSFEVLVCSKRGAYSQ